MWWSSSRNAVATLLAVFGAAFVHPGMVRIAVGVVVVFGCFFLTDQIFVRIEGQPPRRYYKTHAAVAPEGVHVFAMVLFAAFVALFLVFLFVRLAAHW
jgi:hypothetical protein